MLEVTEVAAAYGAVTAVHDVSLSVAEGQVVTLLGANGAGKSSLLLTISGILRPWKGDISLDGTDLTGESPDRIARLGVAHVPEGRHLFPQLTVGQNLRLGFVAGQRRTHRSSHEVFGELVEMFPVLERKFNTPASSLSGGEQQMLALARGLASSPRLLMIDELSMGLAPLIVAELYETLRAVINHGNCSILLVEQYTSYAVGLADYAYVLQRGCVTWEGPAAAVPQDDLTDAYLGGAPSAGG